MILKKARFFPLSSPHFVNTQLAPPRVDSLTSHVWPDAGFVAGAAELLATGALDFEVDPDGAPDFVDWALPDPVVEAASPPHPVRQANAIQVAVRSIRSMFIS